MGKPKAPKTPDARLVADAQADANIKTAENSTKLNRFNQVTPYGSQTWQQDPNDPHKYTLNTQYDPRITSGINSRLNTIGNNSLLAEGLNSNLGGMIGDVTNLYSGAKNGIFSEAAPTLNEDTRSNVSNAIYDRYKSRLDPRFQQAGSDLESRLAAQGITQGSGAYQREIDNLSRDRNDAYTIAMNDADTRSTRDAIDLNTNQWNNRQNAMGEIGTGMNLVGANKNLTDSLLAVPPEAGFGANAGGAAQVANTPYADSVYNSYNGQLTAFGQKMGGYNNTLSGIAGLIGAGAQSAGQSGSMAALM